MERLTERDEYGNYDIIKCPSENFVGDLNFNELNAVTEALNKLGKYENTNLSPAEIERLKIDNKNLKEFYLTDKTGNESLIEALEKRVAENKNLKKIISAYEIGEVDYLIIKNLSTKNEEWVDKKY